MQILCLTHSLSYITLNLILEKIYSKNEKNDYIKKTIKGQFVPQGKFVFYQPFSIVYALNNEFVCSVFLQKTGYEIFTDRIFRRR